MTRTPSAAATSRRGSLSTPRAGFQPARSWLPAGQSATISGVVNWTTSIVTAPQGDGFAALWNLVLRVELGRLRRDYPAEIATFSASPVDPHTSAALAASLGIKVSHPGALEEGWACRQAVLRLSTLSSHANDSQLAHSAPGLCTLFRELWTVYLSALIDATSRFSLKALGRMVQEDKDTSKMRGQIDEFRRSALGKLCDTRQPVAHAETGHIKSITEMGLWPPGLLHGLLAHETIEVAWETLLETDRAKYNSRTTLLNQTTSLVIEQCEAQLEATAKLIESKIAAGRARA